MSNVEDFFSTCTMFIENQTKFKVDECQLDVKKSKRREDSLHISQMPAVCKHQFLLCFCDVFSEYLLNKVMNKGKLHHCIFYST